MSLFAVVTSVVMAATAPGDAPRLAATAHVHRLLTAPDRNVRTFDRRVLTALFDGARRSATFARLLDTLDGSDVIAYIELSHDLPATTQGRMLLATTTTDHRYVRIQVRHTQAPDDLIAVIGHELQHAVEIVKAPAVRDEASMRRHYELAGAGRSHALGFETRAALDAGWRVRQELRKNA